MCVGQGKGTVGSTLNDMSRIDTSLTRLIKINYTLLFRWYLHDIQCIAGVNSFLLECIDGTRKFIEFVMLMWKPIVQLIILRNNISFYLSSS